MKITYSSKNYEISNRFKEIIEKKLNKFDKYFDKDAQVKVNCVEQNKICKLEITINASGTFFRSEVNSDNMYNNIDLALPKIEKQVVKNGQKFKSKLKKDAFLSKELLFLDEMPIESYSKVVKTKQFNIEPITIEDAEAQMESIGHNFYVFLNVVTGKVSVLYRRNDNNLGLIEVNY